MKFSSQASAVAATAEKITGIQRLILVTGALTTMFVWTGLSDPVNLPKMFVVAVLAAWVLGAVVMSTIISRGKNFTLGALAVVLFAIGLFISTLATDNKYTAFFGADMRNNGFFSYFALATLMVAAMMSFRLENIKHMMLGFNVVGLWLTAYGFIQLSHNDPLPWVNAYGPIIGTLGNPDFVSALLGSSAIAMFWSLISATTMSRRLITAAALLAELFILYKTGSIQGLVVFIVGFGLISLTKILQWNKRVGLSGIVLGSILATPILLGLFGMGPLGEKLHRSSVGIRQDYWSAAIHMFKAHPLFGVGIERFGENYFQYAPAIRQVQTQATNNAHNVFLHFLSTGGLILLLPYLALLAIIAWTGLRGIWRTRGHVQINLVSLFAIWIGLALISFISIDNIGVGVWFWISGGALYGASHQSRSATGNDSKILNQNGRGKTSSHKSNFSLMTPAVSLIFSLVALIIMVPAWKASTALHIVYFNRDGLNAEQYVARLKEIAAIQPNNLQLQFSTANLALKANGSEMALSYAQKIIKKDPRPYSAYQLSALVNEAIGKPQDAIPFRLKMLRLNPNDNTIFMGILEDYLKHKDFDKAKSLSLAISKENQLFRLESIASLFEKYQLFDSAVIYRKRAFELDSSNLERVFPLMNDYMSLGDNSGAITLAQKVAQIQPGSEYEARAWDASRLFTRSLPIRQKASALDPTNLSKLNSLLWNFMNVGNSSKARDIASEISRLKPGSSEEADAFENSGQYSRALSYRVQFLNAHPQDPGALLSLASNYMKSGQRALSLPLIEKIQQVAPSSIWSQYAQDLLKG